MFSSAVSATKSHSVVNYRTKGITEMVETVQVPWESMYQLQVCRVLFAVNSSKQRELNWFVNGNQATAMGVNPGKLPGQLI